jgi:hypothetical protein
MKGKFVKPANSFMRSLIGQFENPKPNSLLYNRALLYFIFFLSLFQLYTFSISGNIGLAIVFLLVGFLTSFFSKNMIVILFIALAFTGVLRFGVDNPHVEGMQQLREGSLEEKTDKSDKKDTTETEKASEEKKDTPEKAPPSNKSDETQIKEITEDSKKLEALQKTILNNFNKIAPHMDQAEDLVEKMRKTAQQLQDKP